MKTIAIIAALILGVAAPCFGAGDPVSSITKSENQETTTFRRDGKTILKVILYHSTEPEERRMMRQVVVFNDKNVVDIADFRGKRAFCIYPNSHISVGIQQDLTTGGLESVGLMDDSNVPIELFEAQNFKLTPISGKKLDLNRSVVTDLKKALSPENVKKTAPKGFLDQVMELVRKHKAEESDNHEINDTGDKPTPHDSSRKGSH